MLALTELSIEEEPTAKLGWRDEPARLAVDGVESAAIDPE
jgi:hypothetical protein